MGQTAIISPQILDSSAIGRDLITAANAAAARDVLELEDTTYNWAGDHVFEAGIEATAYSFTAGVDGQLNHPDLASSLYVRFNNSDVYRFNALDFWPVANGTKNLGRSDHRWANVYSVDGSFSGNLDVETGSDGLRFYSTGTDGDTDTAFLNVGFDSAASAYKVAADRTGAGLLRQLWFDASQIRTYESGTLLTIAESNELRMYGTLVPSSDGLRSVGSASKRFGNYYGVDGDFSGTVTANAFVGDGSGLTGLSSAAASDLGIPYSRVFADNLQTDATGFSNFNGGITSYDAGNQRLQVVASGSAKGTEVQYTTTDGTEYVLRVDITLGSDPVSVYSEWADLEATLTTSGVHEVRFTAPAGVGAFGDEVILVASAADTFYINALEIFEVQEGRLEYSNSDIDEKFAQLGKIPTIHTEDFSETSTLDTARYSAFNGGVRNLVSGQLQVTNVESARGVQIRYSNDLSLDANDFDAIAIYLDIEILGEPVEVQSQWAEYSEAYEISATGEYFFKLNRTRTDSSFKGVTITGIAGSTSANFNINKVSLSRVDAFSDRTRNVAIGQEAGSTYSAAESNLQDLGIQIGYQAAANQARATVVGTYAKVENDLTMQSNTRGIFGCASGDETTAIGELAFAGGWRTTALGANTVALGQSSTAMGTGAVALYSHGIAFGRGTYVPSQEMLRGNSKVETSIGGQEIYFENCWGHKFNTPMSDITIGDHVPTSTTIVLHGQDAYDARYDAWDVGTTYTYNPADPPSNGSIVQHNGKAYKTLQTSTGVEPAVTAGWESYWLEFQDVPTVGAGSGAASDFNVDGGHIRIAAGRSTGTGTGGTAGFQIADGVDLGPNTKQALKDAFVVDAANGGSASFPVDVVMAANVDFTGLPTADPLVAGRLWNDGGTMKISAG